MQAIQAGFDLEAYIHDACMRIPGVECLREREIHNYFKDSSLNGVDHWIRRGNIHVFIQDKWKENTTQQEVSQFMDCSNRMQRQIFGYPQVFRMWVSKHSPTPNGRKSLEDQGVCVITCNGSIESLGDMAVMQIKQYLGSNEPGTADSELEREARELLTTRNELQRKKELQNQQIELELEREARELLIIRNELKRKRELQDIQDAADKNTCDKLLEDRFWQETLSSYHSSHLYSGQQHTPAGKILESQKIIQDFMNNIQRDINDAIKNRTNTCWAEFMDDALEKYPNIAPTWSHLTSDGVIHDLKKIDEIELWFDSYNGWCSPPPPPKCWKGMCIRYIAGPLISVEIERLHHFVRKSAERSTRDVEQPRPAVAKKKIQELEAQIEALTTRNNFIEKQLADISSVLNRVCR